MKHFSNNMTIVLIFVAICLVGCKGKKHQVEDNNQSAEPNIVQPIKVDDNAVEPNVAAKTEAKLIVATVNGVDILKNNYEARVEQQIGQVQRQMPANFFEQYKKELGKKVLDEMIVDILIEQKVKQKGVVVTDQEIDSRINEIAQRQKMSLQDYKDMLAAKGEDFNQFKDKVRQNLQFEKLVEADSGPININDSNEAQTKRRELAGQYIQKLKSEAKITYISP